MVDEISVEYLYDSRAFKDEPDDVLLRIIGKVVPCIEQTDMGRIA